MSFFIVVSMSFTLSFLISFFCFLLPLCFTFYVRWNACLQHPVRRYGSCRLSWMSRERSGGKNSRTRIKTPKRSSVSWRELRAPFFPYRRRCHTGLIFLLLNLSKQINQSTPCGHLIFVCFQLARQKKELFSSYEDRDNALLDKELLTNRLKHLESEIETQRTTQNDRSREIRSLEVSVSPSRFRIWCLRFWCLSSLCVMFVSTCRTKSSIWSLSWMRRRTARRC